MGQVGNTRTWQHVVHQGKRWIVLSVATVLSLGLLGIGLLAGCGSGSTTASAAPSASASPSRSAADTQFLDGVNTDYKTVAKAITTIQKESGRYSSWTSSDVQKVGKALAAVNVTYESWHGQPAPSDAMTSLNTAWQNFLNMSHHLSVAYEAAVTTMRSTKFNEAALWMDKLQPAIDKLSSEMAAIQSQ